MLGAGCWVLGAGCRAVCHCGIRATPVPEGRGLSTGDPGLGYTAIGHFYGNARGVQQWTGADSCQAEREV